MIYIFHDLGLLFEEKEKKEIFSFKL